MAAFGTCALPSARLSCRFTLLTSDYEIYRAWLLGALASYPDQIVANNTELVIDGYDVVEKQEYPAMERLVAGAQQDAYDAVILTGASQWYLRGSMPRLIRRT